VVTADKNGLLAIRMENWKLIDDEFPEELPERNKRGIELPLKLQLYNLEEDPAESQNLYDKYPEIARKLVEELAKIQTQESSR
jgi:arylsulfatase A-like enzyme